MKIAIDKGHCLRGYDTSADGKNYGGFNESQYNRILGDLVIRMLREAGHDVIDVTIDDGSGYSNMYGSLSDRVATANRYGVDLYISIHFNASASLDAIGTETWIAPRGYYSSDSSYNANYEYAKRVNDNLVSLGFVNRGIKEDAFYVLANSNAHAILIETCFCTGSSDKKTYDNLGAEKVANAIVSGVLNKNMVKEEYKSRTGYLNVKPFMNTWSVFKDDKYWESWNRLTLLNCKEGLSFKILENPRYAVYKVESFNGIGWCYAEDNGNTTVTSKAAYKISEQPKDPLYKMTVDGKQVADQCLGKWMTGFVEDNLKKGAKEIIIKKVN